MKSLVVEGWRFFPHSYAMVSQHFCLELLTRPEIRLFFREMPFVADVPRSPEMWPPEVDRALRGLAERPADLGPDAVLRIDWPHRFTPDPAAGRTFVWGTTEYKMVETASVAEKRPAREVLPGVRSTIIACSNWARAGFVNCGAPADRVVVVPCGADTGVFHPLPADQRTALRKELGWEGKFVLLNVSAMTGNKGIPVLFKAAAALAARVPQVLIALKGSDDLYASGRRAEGCMAELSPAERNRVRPCMWYAGQTLSTQRMAQLMQAADAYVSPYHAEGFNLPVLEAMACGLPVICTRGGSTEDFVCDDFALRINSYEQEFEEGKRALVPNPVHLGELLRRVVTDGAFRQRAAAAGPEWVRSRFTWKHATDQLLKVLFPD